VREYVRGDPERGNAIWTTAEVQEKELRVMIESSRQWLLVVTKNTHTNRKTLKRWGLQQFAKIKKKNALIAVHIPKGTEIRDTTQWARTMEKVHKWKEHCGKQTEIRDQTFQKIAGTVAVQATNWQVIREKEVDMALTWIDNADKRNGICTDQDIGEMRKLGISRRSAGKIAREMEDGLLQLYLEDTVLKRKVCKKRTEGEKQKETERIYKAKVKRDMDKKKGGQEQEKKEGEEEEKAYEMEKDNWEKVKREAQDNMRKAARMLEQVAKALIPEGEKETEEQEQQEEQEEQEEEQEEQEEQQEEEEKQEREELLENRKGKAYDERQKRLEKRQKEVDKRWKG
jgi:hypothetical protein